MVLYWSLKRTESKLQPSKARDGDSRKTIHGYRTVEHLFKYWNTSENYWSFCGRSIVKRKREKKKFPSWYHERSDFQDRLFERDLVTPLQLLDLSLADFTPFLSSLSLFSFSIRHRRHVFRNFRKTFRLLFPPRPILQPAAVEISNWNRSRLRKSLRTPSKLIKLAEIMYIRVYTKLHSVKFSLQDLNLFCRDIFLE